MMSLSDTLTVGLVLVLLFGAVALYLYTRIQQAEQKITLLESILLDLKMSAEFHSYEELPADEPKPVTSSESSLEAYTPFEEHDVSSDSNQDVSQMDTEVEDYKSVVAEVLSRSSLVSESTVDTVHTPEALEATETIESRVSGSSDVVSDSKVSKYESMTLKELQALAKTRGITGAATMKKSQIMEVLKTSDRAHLSSVQESGFTGVSSTFLETSSSLSSIPSVSTVS
jgi:hypothetical protein